MISSNDILARLAQGDPEAFKQARSKVANPKVGAYNRSRLTEALVNCAHLEHASPATEAVPTMPAPAPDPEAETRKAEKAALQEVRKLLEPTVKAVITEVSERENKGWMAVKITRGAEIADEVHLDFELWCTELASA